MELSIFNPSLFVFLVLVSSIVLHLSKKSKAKICTSNQPPGPPRLPLIGNIHQLICSIPHHRITNLAKTYGPLMHLQLGQISTVVVSSPEVAKQFLKDFDINFSDRGRVSVTDIVFYNRKDIAFAPYGDYWREIRKIAVLKLFSAKRVQMFRFVREEEMLNCIELIRSKVGSPINVSHLVFSYMNSVVARTVVGWKNKNQDEILTLVHRLHRAIAGFGVVDIFPSLEFIHIITGMKSRLLKFHKEADAMLEDIINQHKAELKGRQGEASNLLDVLLELQGDPGSPLTNDSIKAIILEIFAAGTDTSATVVEWAMSELMKNPRLMRKAQGEVREVC